MIRLTEIYRQVNISPFKQFFDIYYYNTKNLPNQYFIYEYNEKIYIIKDILNFTGNIEETKRILDNKLFAYYYGTSEIDAFHEYLLEIDFFNDIPEAKQHFIDIEKVRRDYYNIDIYSTDILDEYLFIFE